MDDTYEKVLLTLIYMMKNFDKLKNIILLLQVSIELLIYLKANVDTYNRNFYPNLDDGSCELVQLSYPTGIISWSSYYTCYVATCSN